MATSINNFFINAIESLTPDDFGRLVSIFERHFLKADEVIDIDGTNDGGCDIRIFKGKSPLMRCVQITVQKNINQKIISDLQKINLKIQEHGYSDTVEYFWSQSISEDKRDEFMKYANDTFGISLSFFDAKYIAGLDIQPIKDFIYSLIPHPQPDKIDKIERTSKVVYDLLSIGHNTSDIKNNLINSLIVFFVYEKGEIGIDYICEHIKSQINTITSDELVTIQINKLRTQHRLVSKPGDNNVVYLSDSEKVIVDDIVKQSDFNQSDFKEHFLEILKKYNQEDKFEDYYKYLENLYKSYYQVDIDESDKKLDYSDSTNKVYLDFQSYIGRRIKDAGQMNDLISDIQELCSNNDYINKICITSSFTSLYKSNKLDSYLAQINKEIYLDTPLLIFLVCKYYVLDESKKWDDPFFQATSSLIDICNESPDRIVLYTTYDYMKEVAGELQKAIKLSYFLDFDFYRDIGEIKNTFINFYLYLKENDSLLNENITDFIDFVLDIGFENVDPDSADFIKDSISVIKDYIEEWDIDIISHPTYEDFDTLKKEYHLQLMTLDKTKSNSAINNDLRTIIRVSSNVNDGQVFADKFLATWDTSFYDFRKLLLKKFKNNYHFFHVYNPSRLLNKICLERFNTNPQIISNDIFAYADATYNISSKVKSLLEMIAPIFGAKANKNIKLLKEIATIRKNEIESQTSEDTIKQKSTQIEDVFINVINYYRSPEHEELYNDFADIIANEQYNNSIISIFKSNLSEAYNSIPSSQKEKITFSIVESINELIKKDATENRL